MTQYTCTHEKQHEIDIERISADGLTYDDFVKYQNNNQPVIITHLQLWSKQNDKTGIDRLNDIIDDNYLFDGIFVSKYKDHRYLYFQSNKGDQKQQDEHDDDKLYFKSMKWSDFYQQLKQENMNKKDEEEYVYLYGQAIPDNV